MPVPLGRAAAGRAGEPLPPLLAGLAQSRYRVSLERGQLAMLAGPPNGGKTAVALLMALRMGVPTLYVSADSDETVVAGRVGAAVSGHEFKTVRQAIEHGLFEDMYGARMPGHLRFMFDPSEPSLQDITHQLTAWLELWGDYPSLIICDNLLNLGSDDANEWSGLRRTLKDLHFLARKTRAAVLVLHHTAEGDFSFDRAPTRKEIQGKLSQLPRVILTVAQHEGEMWMAVVKNTNGPSDPMAKDPVRMIIDFTRMRLWDTPQGRPVSLE